MWGIFGGVEGALDDVGWEVDEGRSWTAVPGSAVCVVDCIWDCIQSRGTNCELGMRCEEGYSIQLLKSALGGKMCLCRTSEEEEREGIDAGIANLQPVNAFLGR